MYNQNLIANMPSFLRPAGQVAAVSPVAQVPSGINANGQVVDQSGALILDATGNPVMAPATSTTTSVPATTTTTTTVPAMGRNYGAALISLGVSVIVIGGAAAIGSYYGARHAMRGARRSDRSSRRAA